MSVLSVCGLAFCASGVIGGCVWLIFFVLGSWGRLMLLFCSW